MKTLAQNYKLLSILHPVAVTADANGTAVDVEQYENDAMIIVDIGAVTGTTPTLDLKIQTSEDGTTYTDALTFTQVTAGSKVAAGKIHLQKVKKIRAVYDVGGTTPSFTMSVDALVEVSRPAADANSVTFA